MAESWRCFIESELASLLELLAGNSVEMETEKSSGFVSFHIRLQLPNSDLSDGKNE